MEGKKKNEKKTQELARETEEGGNEWGEEERGKGDWEAKERGLRERREGPQVHNPFADSFVE